VYFLVTENFFETLRTPILRGRGFEPQDTAESPWVAVINETMARRFWPGEDPIGKHFTVDAISGERPRKVVGIARDVPLRYIRDGRGSESVAYTLYVQQPERFQGLSSGMFGQMTFFVRSSIDPASLEAMARRAAAEVDPNRPLAAFQSLTDFVSEGMRTKGYYAFVVGVFAFMATVLAAIGVYGVMSVSVSQRTREIGIRMAMGATRRDIVAMVGAKALRLVAIGLLFGILGSMALTRLIAFQLWGVTPTDPATYIGITALLLGVSMTACLIPAHRATRVDPTVAIRTE
jgi:putative ABC transport system permease protein